MSDSRLPAERRYDIDAVRVIAFGLLIFYHTAMFYVLDFDWHIKSHYLLEWLQQPMIFLNQWRMALLFVISGMATAILLRKTDRPFLLPRIKKIGIPLIFGMLVIVVPQAYYEALANNAVAPGFLAFWWHYLSLGGWPEGAFSGSDFGITWNHLWYLPYVLFYSVLLALILKFVNSFKLRVSLPLSSGRLTVWYVLVLTVLMLCGWFIFPHFPERTHAFIDDWYNHSLYFTFFVSGYCLMRSRAIWQSLKLHRFKLLALGILSFAGFRVMAGLVSEESSFVLNSLFALVIYLNRLTWIFVVLAFAYSLLNKPSKTIKYANEAVFSWYILHQTVTVILGAWLSPLMLGGAVEGMLVLSGTILSCLLLHHYIVRPFQLLHPLFGYRSTSSVSARSPANHSNLAPCSGTGK